MATISQALVAKLTLDQAQFQTGLKKSTKSAESAGQRMRKGFKVAAVAVAAMTAAVVALGIKLLNAGARAVATRSRFETVFGASTAAVDAFNQEFSKISGLSQQAFEDTIATTAAIAQGMGFAQDASAKFAIEITKVAGDLASFNGLRTEETALAVNSALTGERESMKRLGIVILETDVQQKAFELTGKTVAKTLTQQEKATATLALITERAGVAMGDLERTSSDTDNVIKQVVAAWTDLVDVIGKFLAESPAVRDFLVQIRDIMQQTAVVLKAGGPVVADAARQVGLIIGNAMAIGIFTALQETLKFLDFRRLIPGIGPFLAQTNIAVQELGGLIKLVEGNLERTGIILKDIVADANEAASTISAATADTKPPGLPPGLPPGPPGEGSFGVTQRRLEELRNTLTVTEQIAQSFTDAGVVMAGLPPIIGALAQEIDLLPPKLLVIDERTGQIVEQTKEQIAAVEQWKQRSEQVATVIGSRVGGALTDIITKAKSFGDVIRDLGQSIIKNIVNTLAKAVAKASGLSDALAGAGGLLGGPAGGIIGGIFGGLFKQGGMIPSAATGLTLTPSLAGRFARTSDGGIPIIAHPGEAVITRQAVQDLGGPRAIDAINARSRGVEPVAAGNTNTFNISFPNVRDTQALKRELPGILRDLQRRGAI